MERLYKVLPICLIVLGLVCLDCRPSSTAQLEENKAIIHHYIEAFNKSRLAAMDEALASNAVYYGTGGEELHGLEAMKQLADTFINAFPDFHITIEDQIAEGDKVVSRLTFHGTHRGKMMGIAPTGKEVTWTAIVIHRIDGGKIVEEREIMDELYLMRQLGAIPAAE